MEQMIIDGDWGGDEMQLAAVLLAHPERAHILGATTVFGNASVHHCTRNARNLLHFLGVSHIPVYAGAAHPLHAVLHGGDNAHGDDGMGSVKLTPSPAPITKTPAVDFLLDTLRDRPEQSVTITATGPLTNIAEAYTREPETMRRVKRIIIMGGCTQELTAHDMPTRRGNITPHAEFNMYMAASDAKTVLESGLPITMVPMECSQSLAMTMPRRMQLIDALKRDPLKMRTVERLASCANWIDQKKFNSDQFMHDVHCALIALYPELYETKPASIQVETSGERIGQTHAVDGSAVELAQCLKNANAAFDIVKESLRTCLIPQPNITR